MGAACAFFAICLVGATAQVSSADNVVGQPNSAPTPLLYSIYLRTVPDNAQTSVMVRYNNFGIMINLFARIFSIGAGVMFFFLILSAGYKLIFAHNKSEALGRVRKQLTIGIIGLLVTISAYWITQLLLDMTNIGALMNATTTGSSS